ncbi:MAG: GAF domain-containing protein [Provencibacterium sp.]|jgi:HD-GYP domain-containing protein (c-di-GMP phosphodiesterase class II)|nr:GAF domain-containing protein [Provencibacterium sp.]
MTQQEMEKILEVGTLLSSERNLDRLLEKVLICTMEMARCDAGTLYLLDGDGLSFKIMRNDTLKTYSGGDGRDSGLPKVPLSRENVCALSLLEERTISIEDVRNAPGYNFSGPIRYDAMTGYYTKSMLVVPMCGRDGSKIGVLQLMNALNDAGNICAFSEEMVLVLESMASQASITIQNARYIEEIKELLYSFVRVMSSAVDERTPYNGSHTRHMAEYGSRFIDWLNARSAGERFSPAHKEEILMSVWLHDIGKLVTPLEVMNKVARLLPEQHAAFTHRMQVVRLRAEIDELAGRISPGERQALIEATHAAARLVEEANTAGFITDECLRQLQLLQLRLYRDEDGQEHPWLTPEEYAMLSIRKGTLSDEERAVMEEHVSITDRLLSQIRFSGEFSHVREWAASHHEFLNGSGYPAGLSGEDIPPEVRMITILDIFDALVAEDRPYKRGMPVERALSILQTMADREGKLDGQLVRLFAESRCWEKERPKAEKEG